MLGDDALFIPSEKIAIAEHTDGTAERRQVVARAHRKVSLAFASTSARPSRTPTRALLARTAHDRRDVRQRVHAQRLPISAPRSRPVARVPPYSSAPPPPSKVRSPFASALLADPERLIARVPRDGTPRLATLPVPPAQSPLGRPPDRRLTSRYPPRPAPLLLRSRARVLPPRQRGLLHPELPPQHRRGHRLG